jgi:hypothetical protein
MRGQKMADDTKPDHAAIATAELVAAVTPLCPPSGVPMHVQQELRKAVDLIILAAKSA